MMQPLGYTVYEYANSPSESVCDNKVPILSEEELNTLAGKQSITEFHGAKAVIGSPHWTEFDKRLRVALRERVQPGDIICHVFGRSHEGIVRDFPEQSHAESGIGYPDFPFGCHRIFESYCWMAYHQGKHLNFDGAGRVAYSGNTPNVGRNGSDYEWVVPNSFEVKDWTVRTEPGKYLVFMHRICTEKGMNEVKALAEAIDEEIVVAGQGDMTPWEHKNLKYVGPVHGRARDTLLGNAKAMLMMTRFVEPFGGSGVEAMLTGTPLISSDFGVFSETNEHGKTGFRCHTLGDMIEAVRLAPTLDRSYIAERARRLYSFETGAKQYDRVFTQIANLRGQGWYDRTPLFVGNLPPT